MPHLSNIAFGRLLPHVDWFDALGVIAVHNFGD
jgi:hypothetical protein